MLKLINISKEYQNFKLDSINFNLKKGEFISLLGPSGCGKSTLLKIVAGLIDDFTGKIILDENDINNKKIENREISMVFQEALLFPNMNVEENVAFGLKMKNVDKKTRLKKANLILEDLGLEGFGKRHPMDLSGGQQQRVALARALIVEPKLILMDEPFSSLDYNLRLEMQELIKKIHKEKEMTILFVTHDRDEAFYLSDRIAVMENGKILQLDKAINLYEKPKKEFVASFLGAKNIYKGRIAEGLFKNNDFEFQTLDNVQLEEIKIVLRPETLRLSSKKTDYAFYASIDDYSFKNGFHHIKLKKNNSEIYVVQNDDLDFNLKDLEEVFINYKPEKLIIIKD